MQIQRPIFWTCIFLAAGCAKEPEPRRERPVPAWRTELRSHSPGERTNAIRAAAADRANADLASRAVRSALADTSWMVREAAARALCRMGSAASLAIPELVRAARDSEPSVRLAALLALGIVGQEARPYASGLEALLEDPDPAVREKARPVLRRIDPRLVEPSCESIARLDSPHEPVWRSAIDDLESMGQDAVPTLAELLRSHDPFRRLAAATVLERLGRQASPAAPMLIRALIDRYRSVRETSTKALLAIGPSCVPLLLESLRSGDRRMRIRVADALGEFGEDAAAAAQTFRSMAMGGDVGLRRAGLEGLSRVAPADEATFVLLMEATESPEYEIWSTARRGVGRCGRSPVTYLWDRLASPDPLVRSAAIRVLEGLSELALQSLPVLLRAVRDPQEDVRRAAASALAAIDPKSETTLRAILSAVELKPVWAPSAFGDALGRCDLWNRDLLAIVLDAMARSDPDVRACAARALSKDGLHPKQIVPPLTRAIDDPVRQVRLAALETLANVRAADCAAGPLMRGLADPDPTIRAATVDAIASLRPTGVPNVTLIDRFEDQDAGVRRAVVRALAPWRESLDVAIRRVIRRALADPDAGVRREAERALYGRER